MSRQPDTVLDETRTDAILTALRPIGASMEEGFLDDDYPGNDPDNRFVHSLLVYNSDDGVDYDCAADRTRLLLALLREHGRLAAPLKVLFSSVSDDGRLSLMGECCRFCGRMDSSCQCWNADVEACQNRS